MMIKRLGFVIALLTVATLGLARSTSSYAETPLGGGATTTSSGSDATTEACSGLQDLGVDCNSSGKSAQEIASPIIKSLVNTLSIIVGAVAVVMIIVGGFRFITSGGDADGTKKARNTIIYAAIGLMVVILAQSIVYFAFRKANDLQKAPAPAPTSSVVLSA